MKAAVYRSFGGSIQVEAIPIPPLPEDGIIIQVMATGVCRSDWHGWKGHDDDIIRHGLPFVPGHEVSGVVVKVGRQVKGLFQEGDRVTVPFILSCGSCTYCMELRPTICSDQKQPGFTQFGSFAQFLALPRARRNVKFLPDNVSFVQAAALGCRFTTAYRALVGQGRVKKSDTVAVFGCGGVGLSCIMIASSLGVRKIVAVDISSEALEKSGHLGAHHLVVAGQDCIQEVLRITNGEGAHLAIDAAGFASTCENAIFCTRRGGRMVQVGLPLGDKRPQVPMSLVAGRELELVGSHGFSGDELGELLQLVSSGDLDPAVLVEKEVSLSEGAKAIEAMDKGSPVGITMVTNFHDSRL